MQTNRLISCVALGALVFSVHRATEGATLTDTDSYNQSGTLSVDGNVARNQVLVLQTATNFFAHFANPSIGALPTAILSWDYTTGIVGGNIDVIAYDTSSSTVPAPGAFTAGTFVNTGVTVGSFGTTGLQTSGELAAMLNAFTGTHNGFEFRSTVNNVNAHNIDLSTLMLLTTPPNDPPVAVIATPDGTAFDESASPLTLDGSGSSDPDGDPLTYTWTPGGSSPSGVSTEMSLAAAAAAGLTNPSLSLNVDLEVSDGLETDNASVLLTYDNNDPTASGSATVDANTGDVTASANVSDLDFDAAANFDDNVHYEWFAPDGTTSLDGAPGVTGDTEGFINADTLLSIGIPALLADPILNDGDPTNDFLILRLFDIENGTANPSDFQIGLVVAVIPEPASIALWSMLGLCLGGYFWRRKKAA